MRCAKWMSVALALGFCVILMADDVKPVVGNRAEAPDPEAERGLTRSSLVLRSQNGKYSIELQCRNDGAFIWVSGKDRGLSTVYCIDREGPVIGTFPADYKAGLTGITPGRLQVVTPKGVQFLNGPQ